MGALVVEQFGWERTRANPRRIGLHDSKDVIEITRTHSGTRTRCRGNGIGRGDERIGAVVDIEETTLRALEQNTFVRVSKILQDLCNVRGDRSNKFGVA